MLSVVAPLINVDWGENQGILTLFYFIFSHLNDDLQRLQLYLKNVGARAKRASLFD